MIQNIYPAKFNNSYTPMEVDDNSYILYFRDEKLLVLYNEMSKKLIFPRFMQFSGRVQKGSLTYLFSIDEDKYFLLRSCDEIPENFEFQNLLEIRRLELASNKEIFAVYSAYHLWKWYEASRFCGFCGSRTEHSRGERALVCPKCGNTIYPRINPAVIIGVTNKDKLLITRYRVGYKHNALVAGFTEFGETLEETVQREVMEEAGLKVKNIRYYKSQPWGVAQDVLMGFYCDVDGDGTIHMDEGELRFAEWVQREDIELQPNDYSLTNEMMKMFKESHEI